MCIQAANVEDLSLQDCADELIFKGWNTKIPTNIIIAIIKNTKN